RATCSSSPDAGTAASAAARMIHANRGKGDCAVDMVRDASTTIGPHPRVVQHAVGDAIDCARTRQAEDNLRSRRARPGQADAPFVTRKPTRKPSSDQGRDTPGWNRGDTARVA